MAGETRARQRVLARQFARFGVAGATAFAVDALVLNVGLALGLPAGAARVPSFFSAVCVTWYMNRTFTFRTRGAPRLREFVSYLFAMYLGFLANMATFVILVAQVELTREHPTLALVPATVAGMLLNFVSSRQILSR